MAYPVLVMGESGTGKSASMRNLDPKTTALINVINKPLPFKGGFPGGSEIEIPKMQSAVLSAKSPTVVVDDFGYSITDLYMRLTYGPDRTRDQFEPYKRIGSEVYNLLSGILRTNDERNAEKIVYLMMHTDVDSQGNIVPATVGKMLNEKINLVGMFSTVLLSRIDGDEYGFITNGVPPSKSAEGMFDDQFIPNDLAQVDKAIRAYMGMKPLSRASGGGK